jgi:hypothetical protein
MTELGITKPLFKRFVVCIKVKARSRSFLDRLLVYQEESVH